MRETDSDRLLTARVAPWTVGAVGIPTNAAAVVCHCLRSIVGLASSRGLWFVHHGGDTRVTPLKWRPCLRSGGGSR